MAKKSTAEQLSNQEDEPTIDVGDEDTKGQDIVLEVETPDDQGSLELVGGEAVLPEETDNEQAEYTDNVQKRIDKLTRNAEKRRPWCMQRTSKVNPIN